MHKIINGKRYNTETAKKIGMWETPLPIDHPDFRHEELYRKRSGGYFIHGVGNAGTRWAERIWNGSVQEPRAAEGIIPIPQDKAFRWGRAHMTPEVYDAAFGATPDGTPAALYVQMDAQFMASMRRALEGRNLTLKAFIDRAVRDALAELEKE